MKQGGQKRERATCEASEETCKPKKKAMKTQKPATASPATSKASQQQESEDPQQVPSAAFTPYDYSQTDFKLFAGTMVFPAPGPAINFSTSFLLHQS